VILPPLVFPVFRDKYSSLGVFACDEEEKIYYIDQGILLEG
jgi:hypothetical protein